MTHEVLRTILEAQRANAMLSGAALRTAAEDLVRVRTPGHSVLKAMDAAGERIIGAALTLTESLETYDYTRPFPERTTCLLVGGVIAGPVGVVAAAEAARAAGAARVEIAILGRWGGPLPGIEDAHEIGSSGLVRPNSASAA